MRAEELKGHLDALLLAAPEGGPRHGYAVIGALRQDTGGRLDLPTGTIYLVLRRLKQATCPSVMATYRWVGSRATVNAAQSGARGSKVALPSSIPAW